MRETIADFYGRILGYIEDQGDKRIAKDFYGKILGYYYKSRNVTTNFGGEILFKGDCTSALIIVSSGVRVKL